MKRIASFFFSALLLLCLCISAAPQSASASASAILAQGHCGGMGDGTNLTWTLDYSGLLTVSGSGTMKNYTYRTEQPWFQYAEAGSIRSLIIEPGVTSIGKYAFSGCSVLSSVSLASAVASVGEYAFSDCSALTSFSVAPPSSLTTIESYAFSSCSNMTEFILPDSIVSLRDYAFYNCGKLVSVYLNGNPADFYLSSDSFKWYGTAPQNFSIYVTQEYYSSKTPYANIDGTERVHRMEHSDHSGVSGCLVTVPYSAPTCAAAGVDPCRVCKYCGCYFSTDSDNVKSKSDFVLAKTRHGCFGTTESWTWSDDLSSASQKLTCSKCGYSETFNAEVSSSTAPATCTAAGSKTATATVTYNSNWFYANQVSQDTDTKTSVLPATGHTPAEIPAVPCTETTVGWTAGSRCSVCGEILTAPQKVLVPNSGEVCRSQLEFSANDTGKGNTICASAFLLNPSAYPDAKIITMHSQTYGDMIHGNTSGLFSSAGVLDNCIFCLPKARCATGSEAYTVTIQLDEIHALVSSELLLDTHSWAEDYTVDIEPTETEPGSKSIHCTNCSAKKDAQSIPVVVLPPEISIAAADGGVSYTVSAGTRKVSSVLLVASYDAGGKMTGAAEIEIDLGDPSALTGTVETTPAGGGVYRAFLLDGGFVPMASAAASA